MLSVLFGEDEVVRDSDGHPYTTHPNPPAPPRDITFVGGSGGYREAPQIVPPKEPVIEPLSCEEARVANENLYWFLVGVIGYIVGSLGDVFFR
jgi:hypothetical protein